MDPFSQDILSQSAGNRVSPETLELLGRKASQMFQQSGVHLNQAIQQLVAQHPELGNEHIKRVVEFANNVTFQEQFQNGADKNVHFDVADPGVILRDLKDGGSPAHDGHGVNQDYLSAPKQSDDAAFLDSQIWPTSGTDKVASTEVSYDDLFDAQLNLQGTLQKLAEGRDLASYALDDAKDRLFESVRQEVVNADGAGLGGVMGALTKVASEDLVASVLPGVVERLREEGVSASRLQSSMEKRAGVMVNHGHPMIVAFKDIIKVAHELVVLDDAIRSTERELDQTKAEMKKLAGPVTSGVRDALNPSGKLPAAIRQRFPRK